MIKDDKIRITITIPKKDKAALDELADKDGRNLSNLIAWIIRRYLSEQDKQ